MRLETERLIIASRTLDEMEAVRARETDPELQQVYREICALMRSQPGRDEWACDWLIARKDGTPVGGAGFKGAPDAQGDVEIGYEIFPAFRRQGYMSEALRAMCAWALDMGASRVLAQTLPENQASQELLKKCGFVACGEGKEGPLFQLRPVCLSWEHHGNDTLLWAQEVPGACTRGASLGEALAKMPNELAACLAWRGEAYCPRPLRIAQEKQSDLDIRDADSDVLLAGEEKPLTREEYEALKALCLRSAREFLTLYRSIPDADASCLAPRQTFYGPLPRTARQMYEHTLGVNDYYFGEIGVETDHEGDIVSCRARGFQALETAPDFLQNRLFSGSYGEEWTLRKVMRRFLWHDRIHARAMTRMAGRTFPESALPDPFCLTFSGRNSPPRGEYEQSVNAYPQRRFFRMKLSVFLDHLLRAAEQTGLPLAEVIARAQQEGLHAVECDLAALEQETIRRTLRETNMAVSGIYTSFDFRLKGYEEGVKRLLDRAAEMNAGCVMPLPGLLREGEDLEATRRVMADGVSRVCELAKAYGLQVVLEDFGSPRAPFGPLQGLSWFLEQVPALGCALDSGNFRIHAQDALAAYEQLAPRVRHVHLKSWIDRPDYGEELIPAADGFQCYPAPLGHGPVPNEAVVRALVRDHYEGFCAIEHFSVRDQLSCMIESARWLRGVLESV